jgi:hypothetical protein
MNEYKLTILYTTSSTGGKRDQSFEHTVMARTVDYQGLHLIFFDIIDGKNVIVASYPAQYTIIEDVLYDI